MNTQSTKMVSERTICIRFSKKILGEVPEPPLSLPAVMGYSLKHPHRSKIGIQPAVHLVSGSGTGNAMYILMQFF